MVKILTDVNFIMVENTFTYLLVQSSKASPEPSVIGFSSQIGNIEA